KVETLESFGGDSETASRLRGIGCTEALLLSTCNRVEVYGAASAGPTNVDIARCLGRDEALDGTEVPATFYRHEGDACVAHLFRVASGIDSMVIGETEIL